MMSDTRSTNAGRHKIQRLLARVPVIAGACELDLLLFYRFGMIRNLSRCAGNSAGVPIACTWTEQAMPDNLQNRGPQDRSRVNLNEEWELKYWTKEFRVSEDELRKAVRKVGPSVESVRKELKVTTL
jgi:Protein of unknown function (DUF3606)